MLVRSRKSISRSRDMLRLGRLLSAAFFCAGLIACSSEREYPETNPSVGSIPSWTDSLGGSSGLDDSRPRSYPKGPYGEGNPQVGERLENLTFDGFAKPRSGQLANHSDFESIELNDIRRSDNRFLILHVSAYWCPPCLLAAIDLEDNRSIIERAGATVVELLVDGRSSEEDPKIEELDAWVDSASLTWPTLTPGDERTRIVFPQREHIYLVDLDTMQIVWTAYGFSNDTTVAQRLITELEQSLSRVDETSPQ